MNEFRVNHHKIPLSISGDQASNDGYKQLRLMALLDVPAQYITIASGEVGSNPTLRLNINITLCNVTRHLSVLGQNGTDKMAPIESSINQAIQLPLTI